MFFEGKNINEVVVYVTKRGDKMGMSFFNDIPTFSTIVRSIEENRVRTGKGRYVQGQDIDPEDQKNIMDFVKGLLEAEEARILATANDRNAPLASIKNPAEYFATYADFFYVKAMQLLGCPNMPQFMFDDGFRKTIENCAIAINAEKISYADIDAMEAYDRQRYKNADKIEEICSESFNKIDNNQQTPRNVAALLAEYQALKLRQLDHGAIWRFFHRSENKARTEMLQKMDTYIRKAFPDDLKGLNLDKVDPKKIARGIESYNIKADVEIALIDRFDSKVKDIYGFPAADESKIVPHDPEDDKMPLFTETDIINDVNIEGAKDVDKSEPVVYKSQDNIILEGLNG